MKENELLKMLCEMSDIDPEYVSLQNVSVVGIPAIQRRLPVETQIVQFFTIDEEVIAFIVSRDSVEVVRRLIPINRANFLVTRLRTQLERFEKGSGTDSGDLRTAETINTLHTLYRELFAPLEALITGSRLIIVPEGPLYLIPFHAFFDGQSYLGDRYEISYAPNSSALKHNLERPAVEGEKAVFVLPQHEVRDWPSPFSSSRVFSAENVTRERFFKGSRGSSLHPLRNGGYVQAEPASLLLLQVGR